MSAEFIYIFSKPFLCWFKILGMAKKRKTNEKNKKKKPHKAKLAFGCEEAKKV